MQYAFVQALALQSAAPWQVAGRWTQVVPLQTSSVDSFWSSQLALVTQQPGVQGCWQEPPGAVH